MPEKIRSIFLRFRNPISPQVTGATCRTNPIYLFDIPRSYPPQVTGATCRKKSDLFFSGHRGEAAACRGFGGPSAARPRRALDPWQRSPPSTPAAAHPSPARPLPLPARQADMESPAVIAEEIISPGNHGREEISPVTPWMRPKDGYSTKSD